MSGFRLVLLALLVGCTEPDAPGPTRPEDGGARAAILSRLDTPDVLRRTAALGELLSESSPDAVAAVRDLLEDRSRELGATESLLLVSFWARHAPAEASQWAIARSPTAYRGAAIAASVTEWARVAPDAVVSRLGVTGAYPADEAVMTALVRGWFASGDPGLEEYIRDLGRGHQRQRALSIFARELIERDGPEAAVAWAESAAAGADERFALDLFRQVGSALTMADPRAGVAWCDAHCGGSHGDAVRQLVATRWAHRDATAALDWLGQSSDADPVQRERALRAAFRVFLHRDRPGALSWVESLSEQERAEPWRQPAVLMYVQAIAGERPEDAVAWTARLHDGDQRERTLVSIARRWRERDRAAAEAWLVGSPLSDAARELVRTPPTKRMSP